MFNARCKSGSASYPVARSSPIFRCGTPFKGVLGDHRAALRLVDQDRLALVVDRGHPVQHQTAVLHARFDVSGQDEAAQSRALGAEPLHALAADRRVGDDEPVVG